MMVLPLLAAAEVTSLSVAWRPGSRHSCLVLCLNDVGGSTLVDILTPAWERMGFPSDFLTEVGPL